LWQRGSGMQSSPLFFTASNLYQARGGPHRGRLGRIRCRSDGRIVDLSLSRVSLVGEPLESAIQCAGNFLFRSYRHLRRRGHDRIFSPLSKRRAAFFCAGDFGRWRSDHGHRRNVIFPRTAVLAAAHWHCVCNHRIVSVAPMICDGWGAHALSPKQER